MPAMVTLITTDGRIIHGLNYTLTPGVQAPSVEALVAGMPGGYDLGTFHIQTTNGWEYIPATQIGSVTGFKLGAPT